MSKEGIDHLLFLLKENAADKINRALHWSRQYEVISVGEYDSRQIAAVVFLYESITLCNWSNIGTFLCDMDTAERNILVPWINDTFCFPKRSVYDAFKTWMNSKASLGIYLSYSMNRKYEIMQEAAYNGDKDLLEWLVSNCIDVDIRDSERSTALHVAAENGHTESVKFLLKKGASMFVLDSRRRRPFDLAFDSEHFDICDIMWPSFNGGVFSGVESLLVNAVLEGHCSKVLYISEKCHTTTIWNALTVAIEKGYIAVVETLLKCRPGIRCIKKEKKRETLTKAVEKGDVRIIEKLLAFGFVMEDSILNIAREKKMDTLLEWFDDNKTEDV